MNLLRRTGLIFSLAFAFSLPINASAADEVVAAAPAASAEQPAMQSDAPMHNLMMRERQRMQEPGKCKTMQGAAAVDQDASDPAPGMGMGMGMGMGKGPCHAGKHCENCKHREHCMQGGNCKQRENCKHGGGMHAEGKPCMQERRENCHKRGHMRGDSDDMRLDMLEKRMDMMQIMLEKMMREPGSAK
jgi:hypothetical protein